MMESNCDDIEQANPTKNLNHKLCIHLKNEFMPLCKLLATHYSIVIIFVVTAIQLFRPSMMHYEVKMNVELHDKLYVTDNNVESCIFNNTLNKIQCYEYDVNSSSDVDFNILKLFIAVLIFFFEFAYYVIIDGLKKDLIKKSIDLPRNIIVMALFILRQPNYFNNIIISNYAYIKNAHSLTFYESNKPQFENIVVLGCVREDILMHCNYHQYFFLYVPNYIFNLFLGFACKFLFAFCILIVPMLCKELYLTIVKTFNDSYERFKQIDDKIDV